MARIRIEDLDDQLSDQDLDRVSGGLMSLTSYSFTFGTTTLAKGCGCMGMAQDPGMVALGGNLLAKGCGCMGMAQDPGMVGKF